MKLTDKLYLIFVACSLIALATFLSGCKSSKHAGCDAYSYEIKVEHCHIDEKQYCFYSVDTIRVMK